MLKHRFDPPVPSRLVASSSGKLWAAPCEAGLSQYHRARFLLLGLGFDPETSPPRQLRSLLSQLRASGELQAAVDRARILIASDPLSAGAGGSLHNQLATHPLIWGTDAGAGTLDPCGILERLRPVSRRWREPFGSAVIGACTAIVEERRPRGTPPNYASPGFSPAQLRAAMEDEVQRGWSIPVPDSWPATWLRRSAPCKLVPKSGRNADGSPRSRLIQDYTAAASRPGLQGLNRAVDTTQLEFPYVPSAADICRRVLSATDRSSEAVFFSPADIVAAYKAVSSNAGANPLLTIAAGGKRFMNCALAMGAVFSASALVGATASLSDALRTQQTEVAVYSDDLLMISSGSEADALRDRERAFSTCEAVGLPVAPEKSPLPSRQADFVGLRFQAYPGGATVSVKPATLEKLLSALASVRPGAPVVRHVHEPMLGRAYWLSNLCLPLRAWIRRLAQELVPAVARLPRPSRWSRGASAAASSLASILRLNPSVEVADVVARADGDDPRPRWLLATDASGNAGGAVLVDLHDLDAPCHAARFEWRGHIDSSTRSELLTAVRALQHFAPLVAGCSVRLLTDNMATEAAAARFRASLASVHANDLSEELAVLLLRDRVRLDAAHWPGLSNVCADRLSRLPLQVATTGRLWTEGMSLLLTAARPFCATPTKLLLPRGLRRISISLPGVQGCCPVGTGRATCTSTRQWSASPTQSLDASQSCRRFGLGGLSA